MLTTTNNVNDGATNLTTVPLTEAAAKASNSLCLPTVDSEFCRMSDLRRLFGITRSSAYLLAERGSSAGLTKVVPVGPIAVHS